ncbi:lysylphosphatidylglycerol synthase transmembrane domain-containing protein [Pseudomonas sp. PS01301]|uniref:lysylphosphatidylglycerol synthase transmembrane domain-containing protein n=1 Tax=Pseudomonas sp. PS01301 TaxID=2991437 RepID=UPI00249A3266|nr:lysylphosphatidylglycerol synthase transmembrane domain-containing protein [Pseudomonas sp. PS01301]
MSNSVYLTGWRLKALILSVVGSALGYLGFSLWAGGAEILKAVSNVGLGGLLLALSMSCLNYALRFSRWQLYLKVLGEKVGAKDSFEIYIAGFALTTTPGKAGEALRGVFLKPLGVGYDKSFAVFISERLSDLCGVVALALLGISMYPQARSIVFVVAGIVTIGLAVLTSRTVINWIGVAADKSRGRIKSLLTSLYRMSVAAYDCHRPLVLASALIISIFAWGAEALAFYWILEFMGADIPLQIAIFIYALAMLAGAVSFMPGGLGGAEAVMVGLLTWKGMPVPDAVAATVLIRLATLWFAVAIGAIMLVKRGKILK